MSLGSKYKDPSALLDYQINWAAWLASGEELNTITWDVPSGITEEGASFTSTVATIWLSGGTAFNFYIITCSIVTTLGRKDDRSFVIRVKDK